MVLHVKGVIAAVGSKIPLAIFDNIFMRLYLKSLNSKHRPTYCLERIRIVEIMADCVMLECSRILEEHREAVGGAMMSTAIDFWTCLHHNECFGALDARPGLYSDPQIDRQRYSRKFMVISFSILATFFLLRPLPSI